MQGQRRGQKEYETEEEVNEGGDSSMEAQGQRLDRGGYLGCRLMSGRGFEVAGPNSGSAINGVGRYRGGASRARWLGSSALVVTITDRALLRARRNSARVKK